MFRYFALATVFLLGLLPVYAQLADLVMPPSTDNEEIVFDRNQKLYILYLDGGSPTPFTDLPISGISPRWSPYGLQIVYIADRSTERGAPNAMWIIERDGSEPYLVTQNANRSQIPHA